MVSNGTKVMGLPSILMRYAVKAVARFIAARSPHPDSAADSTDAAAGARGERLAADFLRAHGLRIMQRNYRCRDGEIDIVAEDGATLVFAEVKTRAAHSDELPEAALTARKRHRLCQAARHFMRTYRTGERIFRFDLVGIDLHLDGTHTIHHWPNVINYRRGLVRRH